MASGYAISRRPSDKGVEEQGGQDEGLPLREGTDLRGRAQGVGAELLANVLPHEPGSLVDLGCVGVDTEVCEVLDSASGRHQAVQVRRQPHAWLPAEGERLRPGCCIVLAGCGEGGGARTQRYGWSLECPRKAGGGWWAPPAGGAGGWASGVGGGGAGAPDVSLARKPTGAVERAADGGVWAEGGGGGG
eukprot:7391661-Prymnesium_polylepis.1